MMQQAMQQMPRTRQGAKAAAFQAVRFGQVPRLVGRKDAARVIGEGLMMNLDGTAPVLHPQMRQMMILGTRALGRMIAHGQQRENAPLGLMRTYDEVKVAHCAHFRPRAVRYNQMRPSFDNDGLA